METVFKENHVYKLNNVDDTIFLCENIKGIGKLSLYSKIQKGIYERTNNSYFLNTYIEGDFKSLILNIENYELLGTISSNYEISKDKQTIFRKVN